MKNEFSRSTSIFFGPLEPINNAPDGNSGEPRHRIAHNLTREGLGDNMIGSTFGRDHGRLSKSQASNSNSQFPIKFRAPIPITHQASSQHPLFPSPSLLSELITPSTDYRSLPRLITDYRPLTPSRAPPAFLPPTQGLPDPAPRTARDGNDDSPGLPRGI